MRQSELPLCEWRQTYRALPRELLWRRSHSQYVRRDQLAEVLAACEAHQNLQAQLRAGRAEYKQLLAQTRRLVKLLKE